MLVDSEEGPGRDVEGGVVDVIREYVPHVLLGETSDARWEHQLHSVLLVVHGGRERACGAQGDGGGDGGGAVHGSMLAKQNDLARRRDREFHGRSAGRVGRLEEKRIKRKGQGSDLIGCTVEYCAHGNGANAEVGVLAIGDKHAD